MESSSTVNASPPTARVPRWAWHRRTYDWMLSFSHSRSASLALFLFSFTEAIFFPIPPLVLQIPMSLERRARTWWYAGLTTAASVLGGAVGYLLGLGCGELIQGWFPNFLSDERLGHFEEYTGNVWLLTAGAIAIHPFKLYTIAAGILAVPFFSFVVASIVGRGLLFYGVAVALWYFGPPIRTFIDRYFNLLTVVFGVLIIALVVLVKVL